jgi:hypothetical protein
MNRDLLIQSISNSYEIQGEFNYNYEREQIVDKSSIHFGKEYTRRLLNNKAMISDVIQQSYTKCNSANTTLNHLKIIATDSSIPYTKVLDAWNIFIYRIYEGALDEVVDFELAIKKLKDISPMPENSTIPFELMLGTDGKNVMWYREFNLCLHLAYKFRKSSHAFQAGTYDQFGCKWMSENFIPLSKQEAFDLSGESIPSALKQFIKDIKLLKNIDCDNLYNSGFDIIRETLLDLHRRRNNTVSRFETAKLELIQITKNKQKDLVSKIADLIGSSITINELIHYKICLACNLLRNAAQARGMDFVII